MNHVGRVRISLHRFVRIIPILFTFRPDIFVNYENVFWFFRKTCKLNIVYEMYAKHQPEKII